MELLESTVTDMAGQESQRGDPTRKGLRRRVTAGVAVLVIAAVIGLTLLHRSLGGDLLSSDGGMSVFPGEDVQEAYHERDEVEVKYEHNGSYTFAFSLRNESRWAVRVAGFPVDPDEGMLQPEAFSVDTTPFDAPSPTFAPLRPFTIDPGESVLVQVEARFANCDGYSPDSSSTLLALPVRYRALWATRTRWIDLPTAIQVPVPESCPIP